MRKKLIEMLMQNYGSFILYWDNENPETIRMTSIINIADFLIANGVVIPVKCKNCKYYIDDFEGGFDYIYCERTTSYDPTYPDNYCNYGEIKTTLTYTPEFIHEEPEIMRKISEALKKKYYIKKKSEE